MNAVIDEIEALDLGKYLKPGDRIIWGQACGEPTTLVRTLLEQAPDIGELSAFTSTSFSGLLTPEACGDHLKVASMGAIGALRKLAAAGQLGIIPCHVSRIAPMIREGSIGCDVAMVQVSPPDSEGRHSFGLIHDTVRAAVETARVVIAEVNDQVPFTLGAETLHADEITCAVRCSSPPVEVASAGPGETDTAIARHLSGFIEDGSCLQVGIGGVPDAVMRLVGDRKDLGIHSGMIGDSVAELMARGVITNARKPIDQGVAITGALIGTRKLFDFAHQNGAIGMRSSTYTHGQAVLGQLSALVTINSAVEVDLTGQVNAEQSGDKYLGGTGGQVDYVRAGLVSEGGRSVIALPSTARKGTVSRIVPTLSGPVTTSRSDVDIIVTEFGAAELQGLTLAERTRRLVEIAHPDFREELERAAHGIMKRGF